MEVKILQLDKELSLPKYETDGSAGMDLYSTKHKLDPVLD